MGLNPTPIHHPPHRRGGGPWDTWLHPILLQAEAEDGVFGGLGRWVQGTGLAGLAAASSPRNPGPGGVLWDPMRTLEAEA